MNEIILTIVGRDEYKNTVSALVKATVYDDFEGGSNGLEGTITSAVTEWINQSDAGKKAWKESSGRFNVMYLSKYLEDDELQECLMNYGIRSLEITINNTQENYWDFDSILVNILELDED